MEMQFIWFLVLDLISIAILTFTFVKKKDVRLVPFLLAIMGLSYILEYVIKVLFESYVYYPRFLKNRYYDDLLGANASQAFAVPSVALLVSAFRLNYRWMLLFVGIFIGIEKLFLYLNIYEHRWWRISYTMIGVLLFFIVSKHWLAILKRGQSKLLKYFTLVLATLTFEGTLFFYVSIFFHAHQYHIGLVNNEYRDSLIFALPFFLFVAVFFTHITIHQASWFLRGIAIVIVLIIDYILWKVGILEINQSWIVWYYPVVNIMSVILLSWMNRKLQPHLVLFR